MTAALLLLFAQSHLERAGRLLRDQNVEAARAELDQALAEQPNSVPALTLQGRLAMAENRFDAARAAFAKAAELAPSSASAQFLLGFFHYVDNDFVKALPVLQRARKLAPDDARTALFLALTFDGLGQPEQAQALYEEALRLEVKAKRPTAETHVAYARMLFAGGLFEEAQQHVARALALDGASRDAHYEQARLHFEAGRFAECIAEAEKALQLTGTGTADRSIHFLLSRAYGRTGDRERSAAHRRQFEAIPPRLVR